METEPVTPPSTPFNSVHMGPPPPYNRAWAKAIPAQNSLALVSSATCLGFLDILFLTLMHDVDVIWIMYATFTFSAFGVLVVFAIIERALAKRFRNLPPTKTDTAIQILVLIRNFIIFQFAFVMILIPSIQLLELVLACILGITIIAEIVLLKRRNSENTPASPA